MNRYVIGGLGVLGVLVLAITIYFVGIFQGWHGRTRGPGEIAGSEIPAEIVTERRARQAADRAGVGAPAETEILFGDLHVHSTFSTDAFVWALPLLRGEGANPLADACDFARYCSALDFWSITDHAEALTPARWAQTLETMQRCEAQSSIGSAPDVVPFIGFEWTQVAPLPEDHYGHKNVIFRSLDADEIAARPIAAAGTTVRVLRDNARALLPPEIVLLDMANRQDYYDFGHFIGEIRETPLCDPDLASADLPPDCYELAATPGELIERLESQNLDTLVIPHGSTWGLYTPPGTTWDKQLLAEQRPEAFSLIEVFSGHGNSEEYRPWRAALGTTDEPICPPARPDYLPACQRAGQIIEERCLEAGETAEVCAERAETARRNAVDIGLGAHLTVRGEAIADWLDAGQCRDCFLPAFNYNPTTSVQYGLAITDFDGDDTIRFRWGFIGSSDTHTSRPGIGYKPFGRHYMTDAGGAVTERVANALRPPDGEAPAQSVAFDRAELLANLGFQMTEIERQSSFFTGGGLVAAHATERSRDGIWDALQTRNVYATSGLRQLLWFDLVDSDGNILAPMGGDAELADAPVFRVRAVGSLRQNPGCPDYAVRGLEPDRLQRLCRGECYNPGNERYRISRIEVVRIRPQITPDEDVDFLIEDDWLTLPCDDRGEGCAVEFSDPEFASAARDAVYYVRAIQEASGQVNGDPLRCEYDAAGRCVRADPCLGDYRVDMDEECIADVEHRAWSSPIYLGFRAPDLPVAAPVDEE